jgi:hypothetical protein
MVVPFAPYSEWDLWIRPIVRTDPLGVCSRRIVPADVMVIDVAVV